MQGRTLTFTTQTCDTPTYVTNVKEIWLINLKEMVLPNKGRFYHHRRKLKQENKHSRLRWNKAMTTGGNHCKIGLLPPMQVFRSIYREKVIIITIPFAIKLLPSQVVQKKVTEGRMKW